MKGGLIELPSRRRRKAQEGSSSSSPSMAQVTECNPSNSAIGGTAEQEHEVVAELLGVGGDNAGVVSGRAAPSPSPDRTAESGTGQPIGEERRMVLCHRNTPSAHEVGSSTPIAQFISMIAIAANIYRMSQQSEATTSNTENEIPLTGDGPEVSSQESMVPRDWVIDINRETRFTLPKAPAVKPAYLMWKLIRLIIKRVYDTPAFNFFMHAMTVPSAFIPLTCNLKKPGPKVAATSFNIINAGIQLVRYGGKREAGKTTWLDNITMLGALLGVAYQFCQLVVYFAAKDKDLLPSLHLSDLFVSVGATLYYLFEMCKKARKGKKDN